MPDRGPIRRASVLVAAVALLPRAWTAGSFQTTDEILWMERSVDFGDALLRGDLAAASSSTDGLATMPGITTMWLGVLARGAWAVAGGLGLIPGDAAFVDSAAGIHLAQLGVAVTTAVLIGVLVALAWRWVGPVPAVAAGLLLASEPFFVAHSALLHTDALTALFGVTGSLALLLALGVPRRTGWRTRRLAAAAGLLLAGAVLTKVSALTLAPGLVLVVAVAVVRRARIGGPATSVATTLRAMGSTLGTVLVVGTATVLATWPALWADPLTQLGLLRESAGLAGTAHTTFFLGEITGTPGPLFYAIATPLRMTPWFLVGCLVLVPLALARGRRAQLVALAVIALPVVVVLSTAAKQLDRYILVVVPFVALMVGIGVEALVRTVDALVQTTAERPERVRWVTAAGGVAGVAVTVHALVLAPWGLAYFNPLLGGSEAAERSILVGWGEGLEQAGERIRQLEAPDCDVTVALRYARLRSAFPCGRTTSDVSEADYVVVYVNQRQRLDDDELAHLRSLGQPVEAVRIRGVDYAEIYDLRVGAGGPDEAPAGLAATTAPPS